MRNYKMKKFKNPCILLLLGFTIYLCFRNYKLSREVENLNQSLLEVSSDTVYIEKPFQPSIYSQGLEPEKVIFYQQQTSNIDSCQHQKFETAATPKKDSLVQVFLKSNKLDLSFYDKSSDTHFTRIYPIDLEKYQYSWYDGKLTQKRVSKLSLIKPYVYSKYRVFNKFWDMGLGISVKTTKINYKLGINTFYYPKLKSGLGTDIEFQILYNF